MDDIGVERRRTGRWVRRGNAIELALGGPDEADEEFGKWLRGLFGSPKATPPAAATTPPPRAPSSPGTRSPYRDPAPVPPAPRRRPSGPAGPSNLQILQARLEAVVETLAAASKKAYREGMTEAAARQLAELRRQRNEIQMQIDLLRRPRNELEWQLQPADDPAVLALCRTAGAYAVQLATVRSTRLPPGAQPWTRRVPTKAPGYLEATTWMNRTAQRMTVDRLRRMSTADIDRVVGCLGRIEAVVRGRPSAYMQRLRTNAAAVLAGRRP